ncbi:MAG TPA: Mut7-C RNAse domain-containing protein, partial [Thermoanaerobaculia bacterium]|nr:Mut7-C RNAse domain-containing protein [Thermoanaerobaculia bacterium]
AYAREREPGELIERARGEGRILLTRDRRLAARRKIGPHVLIASDDLGAQLRQVIGEARLEPRREGIFRRCVECNRALVEVDYEQAAALVPPYVAATQERFHRCPSCGRIYWPATHPERALRRLREWGIDVG